MEENDCLECSSPTSLPISRTSDCYRLTAELPEDFQMLEETRDCRHEDGASTVHDDESRSSASTRKLDAPVDAHRHFIPSSFSYPTLSQLSSGENKEYSGDGEGPASFSVETAESMMRRRRSFDPDRDLPESWTKKYLARLCRSPPPSSTLLETTFAGCTTTADDLGDDGNTENRNERFTSMYDTQSHQNEAISGYLREGNRNCATELKIAEDMFPTATYSEKFSMKSEGMQDSCTWEIPHSEQRQPLTNVRTQWMGQNESPNQISKTATRRRRRLPDLPKQPRRQIRGRESTGSSKLSKREEDESVHTPCPTSEGTFNGAANPQKGPARETGTDMSVESPSAVSSTFAHLEFHPRAASPGAEPSNRGRMVESFFGGPELIQLYYNGYPRPVLVLRCQHCHPLGGYGLDSQSLSRRAPQKRKDSCGASDTGSVASYETDERTPKARHCPETPSGITQIARQQTRAARQIPEISSSSPGGSLATSAITSTSGTAPKLADVPIADSDRTMGFSGMAANTGKNSERRPKDVSRRDTVGSLGYEDDVLGNPPFSCGSSMDSCPDEQTFFSKIDTRSDSPGTPLETNTVGDDEAVSTLSRSSTITSSMTSSGYGTTTPSVEGIFSSLTSCENISTHLDSLEPTHRALHRFHPRHVDELELDIGDPIYVVKEAEDLWCEGVNLRTGRQGIFPAAHAVDLDYSDFDPLQSVDPPSKKERFLVKYLGSVETATDRGADVVVQSVAKITRIAERIIQTERNNNHDIATVNNKDHENGNVTSSDESSWNTSNNITDSKFQSQTCVLEISDAGIRMVGNKKGTTMEIEDYFYPLANISYCGVNPEDARFVGVITKHPTITKFACHIFQLETSAKPLASAVGLAFERFYQKVLENAFPIEEFYLE